MRIRIPALPILAGTLMFSACSNEPAPTSAPGKSAPASVMTVQYEAVPATLQAPGAVQPRDRVALSSQINGFVREVRVRAGDVVAAGQVLVTLDARDVDSQKAAAQSGIDEARAALAEARKGTEMAQSMRAAARASLDLANGTYARYQKLFETRSVSPQELDEVRARRDGAAADFAAKETMVAAAQDRWVQIEAKIAQATAQLQRADVYVGWAVIKAPAAGRVVERSIDPGSAIFPGGPLITLESTSRPQVLATLPTTDAGHLKAGLEVPVHISDQAPVTGRIAEIIPLSSLGSHTVQFKVDLPAGSAAVSGSYATVDIPTGTRQALLVPVQAVRESGQLTGVFVVDSSSIARFRLVKVAPFDAERVELLAGLAPGERILAKLADTIVDGTSLEVRQ
jgi:HlyD family secretion protein